MANPFGLTIGSSFTDSGPTGGLGTPPPGVNSRSFVGDLGKDVLRGVGDAVVGAAGDFVRGLIPGAPGGTPAVPGGGGIGFSGAGRSFQAERTCPDGSASVFGQCIDFTPGGAVSGGGMSLSFGEAVMGRYGAALVPAQTSTVTRHCPRGAVLGNDGLCYNKRDLRKSDRMHIPARKPLLTGGDLNAISRAARAASKMKVQQKRLEKLGLLKKPSSSRRAPARRPGAGVVAINQD